MVIFGLYRYSLRPEVADDIPSCISVEDVSPHIRVKFQFRRSRLNRS